MQSGSRILVFLAVFGVTSSDQQNKNERVVLFPEFNDTGPSLPVFPDTVVEYVGGRRQSPPLVPAVDKFGSPLCVKGAEDTFCEEVNSYPISTIRNAIHFSADEFNELFGTQTIHPRRITEDVSEETVCPYQSKFFYPKAAVNEIDQWVYVVNDVDYVQTVMAEICETENEPCRYLDGALPSGVSSRCRQKYAYKRLLALHPNQKKTYTDAFRFPSCCVCYVKKPFVLTRSRNINVPETDKKNGQ